MVLHAAQAPGRRARERTLPWDRRAQWPRRASRQLGARQQGGLGGATVRHFRLLAHRRRSEGARRPDRLDDPRTRRRPRERHRRVAPAAASKRGAPLLRLQPERGAAADGEAALPLAAERAFSAGAQREHGVRRLGDGGSGGRALRERLPGAAQKGNTMRIAALLLCTSLVLAALSAAAAENLIAIVGATVIHPERDLPAAVAANRTIIVRGSRIARIGPAGSTPVPAGATRIDARGKWVIPGLVDGHVHFFQSGNLYTRPDVPDFNAVVPYLDEVARNKARLPATFRIWLASGVTRGIDIGGPYWNFEVRDAARKSAAAPRVAAAGPLVSMVEVPLVCSRDPHTTEDT